ncbi:uncharacterized protein LOC129600886 [Paramacrobiotus metropolitanus]|uniref:uncharacterized protein LOC129600886 n=1 Tax=Paramacrobiotus metropolitanus TaxID=2943436 RepID=UPI0024457AE0|nr:uncharacterized protein LOC129600886 [Paramacrobiotus metropolitanus]
MPTEQIPVSNLRAILCLGVLQTVSGMFAIAYAIIVLSSVSPSDEISKPVLYGSQLTMGILFVIAGTFGVVTGRKDIDAPPLRTHGNQLSVILLLSIVGLLSSIALVIAALSVPVFVDGITFTVFSIAALVHLGQIVASSITLRNLRRKNENAVPVAQPLLMSRNGLVASAPLINKSEDLQHFQLTLPNTLL